MQVPEAAAEAAVAAIKRSGERWEVKREEIKQKKRQKKQKKINNGSAFVGRWAL